MKRAISLACSLALTMVFALSCSSGEIDSDSEGVGATSENLSKCLGGKQGQSDYCSSTCKCDYGEGDCDTFNDCNVDPVMGQLRCTGNGLYFCGATNYNICAPLHCGNKILDADLGETVVDCGGECGTCCPGVCDNLPANGQQGHCTADCPCTAGHGDCQADDALCQSMPNDHVCLPNVGASFGFPTGVDVCVRDHCTSGMQDGDETGVDCGPSCLPCAGGSTLSFAKGGAGADHGLDVAIDGSGAIVIAGRFGGTTSFGGASLTASGGSDVYVARYNSLGSHAWSKRFGGNQADGDLGVSVAVDSARNVYVGGNYRGTIDFGGGFTHTAVGTNTDAFVVKFNQSGTPQWSRSYGDAGAERVNGLTVSGTGTVFVAGSFASVSVDFGGGARTNAGAQGTFDAFALSLTTGGAHIYSPTWGSTGADHANDVAIDASLNGYYTGQFVGTAAGMTALGGPDAYVIKLTSAGAQTFAVAIGGTNDDSARAIALDSLGPVVAGQFQGTADFGDGVPVTALGVTGAFAVAFDTAGAWRYNKSFVTDGQKRGLTVAGATGGVVVAGDFQGTQDFGFGAVTATGTRDVFVVRYDTTGGFVWGAHYAGTVQASPFGATHAAGFLGLTGSFRGSIAFGGPSLSGGGLDEMFFTRQVF